MKRISANHPLTRTRWTWPEGYVYLYNHYAQFRRDFDLPKVPPRVPLSITADKSYRLYINGQYICRGPARGYQSHWPYDQLDISIYLKKGHNWIAVEAYNPGISTFQYLHQNYAGMLCAIGEKRVAAAWNKTQWQMRRDPARETQTARLSLQVDFQEHIDLAKDDRSWITSETPPQGWVAELFDKPHGHNYLGFPYGMPPFDTLEERGIPLLKEQFIAPSRVTSSVTGQCGQGYRTWKNVAWPFIEEAKQITDWGDGSHQPSAEHDGSMVLTIDPPAEGQFRAVTIEVGEYVLGELAVTVDDAAGGEILDFYHHQYLRDGKPKFVKPGDGCLVANGNRMRLRAGQNDHEFYHPLGFGHFTVIVRDAARPLTLRLKVRKVGYPFTMRGQFECSEPVLNQIHAACRRTQQLCALDAYMDTPWREQAQWWGDARVQARNTFYLDGDARLLARGIQSVGDQPLACGLTPGHAPTSSYWCILPDFSLTWILTIWDYYWQTGDLKLFKTLLPRVRKVLAYFASPQARADNGLLKYDPRFWLFEDWSTLPKETVPTFLNLWYCLALRAVGQLCEAADKSEDAKEFEEQCGQHVAKVIEHLYDRQQKLFLPALDAQMQPCGRPSVHDQVIAMMLEICPEANQTMINKLILPYLRGEELTGPKPSAFWSTYVLQQMIARGFGEEALGFIRRGWTPMLATGTTWEGFDWDETAGGSACHAWTGHPSSALVNLLAGVYQLAPAWGVIRVKPFFAEGIDHVSVMVPTPRGDLRVQWQRDNGKITGVIDAPPSMQVQVEAPGAHFEVKLAQPTTE